MGNHRWTQMNTDKERPPRRAELNALSEQIIGPVFWIRPLLRPRSSVFVCG